MRELFDIFAAAMLFGGLFGLAALTLGVLVAGAVRCAKIWRRARHAAVLSALAAAAIIVGGTKVTVNDPYIRDSGSYVTNDLVHVAVERKFDFIPMETEVWIFSRLASSTNAADWTELLPRHTLADFPVDILIANATNYTYYVAANYVPAPTVHTNGVWNIKGFTIPDSGGRMAFPNTKTATKETP